MNKINFVIFIALGFLTQACSTTGHRSAASETQCPRQAEFDAKLKQIEPVIDSMSPGANSTQSVEVTCTKQKYTRAGYEMVVFVKPDGMIGGTAQKPKTFEVPPEQCLQEATDLLQRFHNNTGLNTMAAYQDHFPELYKDMDVGPVKWLVCSKEKNAAYYVGWATWVHEVVHDLRNKNCLFNPQAPTKPMCFEMPESLPDRSVAAIGKWPTKNPKIAEFLNSVQTTYLQGAKEPPVMLFDEVSGYTQTLKAMSMTLKNLGPAGLYTQGDRNVVLMPLFAVYSLNYLDQLRKIQPDTYKNIFGKGSMNRESLKALFAAAEQAYSEWKKVNSCKTCTTNDFEDGLWNEYLKRKKAF